MNNQHVGTFCLMGIMGTILCIGIADLKGMLAYTFKTAPQGPYQQSCRNISMHLEGSGIPERIITAECRADDGSWKLTSIRLPYIQAKPEDCQLRNQNGELRMECEDEN